jgi:hypothetical protein
VLIYRLSRNEPPALLGDSDVCGTNNEGQRYDCRDCTCSSSALSNASGHYPHAVIITGIYYIAFKRCGKDC